MGYMREFELVNSGPIAVQHNLSFSQQLLPNRGPITLGNGTWSWGPLPSDPGIESEESERGRATPLHQTTPLFPSCVVGAVAGFISALADVYFINLHVLPTAAIRDEIFLGCDVPRPRGCAPLVCDACQGSDGRTDRAHSQQHSKGLQPAG